MTVAVARRRLLILTAIRWTGVGLLLPVIVLALTDRGIPLARVGVLFAVSGLTTALLEIPTGGLADAIGRRGVLIAARAAMVVATAGLLVADQVWMLVIVGGVMGAARALDSGPLESWYIDLLHTLGAADRMERDLARTGLVTNLAIAGGGLLAGMAATVLGRLELPFGLRPLDIPLVMALVLAVVDMLSLWWLMVETPRSRVPGVSRTKVSWRAVSSALSLARRRLEVRSLLGAEMLWGVAITAVEILWQPRVAEQWPAVVEEPLALGIIGAAGFAAGALGAAGAELAAIRWPTHVARSAMIGRLGHGIAVCGLALAGGVPLVVAAYVLSYVGNGGVAALWVALLHRHADAGNRASLVSLASVTAQGGGAAGSLAFPVVAATSGITQAWLISGAVMLLSAPLMGLAGSRRGLPASQPVEPC